MLRTALVGSTREIRPDVASKGTDPVCGTRSRDGAPEIFNSSNQVRPVGNSFYGGGWNGASYGLGFGLGNLLPYQADLEAVEYYPWWQPFGPSYKKESVVCREP